MAGSPVARSVVATNRSLPLPQLKFFGGHASLAEVQAFTDYLEPLRQCEWVVYAHLARLPGPTSVGSCASFAYKGPLHYFS
jgi:hypothetical protein